MRALRFLIIMLLIPLAACSVSPRSNSYMVETVGPYTLDSGDVVRVMVYGDDALSDNYLVDDTGKISFPLVGPTLVRGKTTAEAAAALAAALANGFMRNPDVSVEIAQYRPFYIQGEVSVSGQYAYAPRMTVRAAISIAGGFKDTAERSRVTLYRPSGNEIIKGNVGLDFPILPGDTIVVMDRWI